MDAAMTMWYPQRRGKTFLRDTAARLKATIGLSDSPTKDQEEPAENHEEPTENLEIIPVPKDLKNLTGRMLGTLKTVGLFRKEIPRRKTLWVMRCPHGKLMLRRQHEIRNRTPKENHRTRCDCPPE